MHSRQRNRTCRRDSHAAHWARRPEESVGEFVVKAFKTVGPNAVPDLTSKLSSPDPRSAAVPRVASASSAPPPPSPWTPLPRQRRSNDYDCLVRRARPTLWAESAAPALRRSRDRNRASMTVSRWSAERFANLPRSSTPNTRRRPRDMLPPYRTRSPSPNSQPAAANSYTGPLSRIGHRAAVLSWRT